MFVFGSSSYIANVFFIIILTSAGLAQSLGRLTVEREEVWIPGAEPLLRLKRWLDTVFQGQYLPSLSINYVTINKNLEKLPPQLYQIKMKIWYDQGCNDKKLVIGRSTPMSLQP